MKDNTDKKDEFSIEGKLFSFILLTTIIGAIIGYLSGMQTPQKELVADIRIEEIAFIRAVIFGIGGSFIGIAGLIVYGIFALLRKHN